MLKLTYIHLQIAFESTATWCSRRNNVEVLDAGLCFSSTSTPYRSAFSTSRSRLVKADTGNVNERGYKTVTGFVSKHRLSLGAR